MHKSVKIKERTLNDILSDKTKDEYLQCTVAIYVHRTIYNNH